MEEIFKNKAGKVIGKLKDGVYRKEVSRKKHLMKNLLAWGVDAEVMSALKGKCTQIRIRDKDTSTIYYVSYETFMEKGKAGDYGDGLQYFLSLTHWNT